MRGEGKGLYQRQSVAISAKNLGMASWGTVGMPMCHITALGRILRVVDPDLSCCPSQTQKQSGTCR